MQGWAEANVEDINKFAVFQPDILALSNLAIRLNFMTVKSG
jgi:hypothetical protein